MKLHELRDNPGATRSKKRVGRGPGSGKGKTAGRGIKGQKSRSGVAIKGYEGGQMPLYQRLPKRGFNKPNRKKYAIINLGVIQKFIDAGKLTGDITEDSLVESGAVRRKLDGVRVLAKGVLTAKVTITVTGASTSAKEKVEKLGGMVTVIVKVVNKMTAPDDMAMPKFGETGEVLNVQSEAQYKFDVIIGTRPRQRLGTRKTRCRLLIIWHSRKSG